MHRDTAETADFSRRRSLEEKSPLYKEVGYLLCCWFCKDTRRGFAGIRFSRNLHPILFPLLPGWPRLCRILYPAQTPGEPHAGLLRAQFALNPSHVQLCSIAHEQQDNLTIWKSRSHRHEHCPAPWGSPRSDPFVFYKQIVVLGCPESRREKAVGRVQQLTELLQNPITCQAFP